MQQPLEWALGHKNPHQKPPFIAGRSMVTIPTFRGFVTSQESQRFVDKNSAHHKEAYWNKGSTSMATEAHLEDGLRP